MDDVLDAAWGQSPEPHGPTALEHLDSFCSELRRRVRKKYQNVIVIDGKTGKGKSSLGMQVATKVEPDWDIAHTAYCADDGFRLWGTLKKGQTLLYDESVLGLLTQGGRRNDELIELVQAISIIRAKGITTILCLPSIWMLDSFVREGLAEFWLNVYERGRAKLHRSWERARYKRPSRIPYDADLNLSPIGFRNLDRTATWKEYEARKIQRINDWLVTRVSDPKGKTARCPRCGLVSSRYNVTTHRCPGLTGPAAPPPTPTRPGDAS